MKIKTIDVNALEWFDRINGNSYFSGEIIVNLGMKGEKRFLMPFQYGYGNAYEQEACDVLVKEGIITSDNVYITLWRYCADNKIIMRSYKQENCKKSQLKS